MGFWGFGGPLLGCGNRLDIALLRVGDKGGSNEEDDEESVCGSEEGIDVKRLVRHSIHLSSRFAQGEHM